MKLGSILVTHNNGSGSRRYDFSNGPSKEQANPDNFLTLCLESYRNTAECENEFIIVDDGSTDDSVDIIQRYSDLYSELIVNESNIGLSPSMMIAADRLIKNGCDVICRFDADIEFITQGWDTRLLNHFQHYPQTAAAGGCQLLPMHSIWACGDMMIHPRGYSHILLDTPTGKFYDASIKPNENLIIGNVECDSVMGCFAAFRSTAFRLVGGLREEFYQVRGQTEDLNLRFLLNDYQCMALGNILFYHRHFEHVGKNAFTDTSEKQDESLVLWKNIWGWEKLKPDLAEILQNYKGTRLCRHLIEINGDVSYIGP
ncbi:MAG: glycosyltransferase [Lentisphaeria bacterium]|nr:glycosyltransferase [Lentisphaeria bacterium]